MPTARNGEWFSQASIDFWVGARHWSKPNPRKLPGVATLPVAADEAGTRGPVAVVRLATTARAVAASRGRSSIGSPGLERRGGGSRGRSGSTATENDKHNSHICHRGTGELHVSSSPVPRP